ncbi:hypothetical protein [Priestia koreensis]|uniref:hypothetical protein n=1 Tax=Priestia koreensis TaxID=284581 RepID=UPI003458F0EA
MLEGYDYAKEYGQDLISCEDKIEAKVYYYQLRERVMKKLRNVSEYVDELQIDYSPGSLLVLELLYFDLYETNRFDVLDVTRQEMEECLAVYLGEVTTAQVSDVDWVVEEYPFIEGKYIMGIRQGTYTLYVGTSFLDHYKSHSNQTLYYHFRSFQKRAS